jgi:hypothetical protein
MAQSAQEQHPYCNSSSEITVFWIHELPLATLLQVRAVCRYYVTALAQHLRILCAVAADDHTAISALQQ